MIKLRQYQQDTIDAIFNGWANSVPGNYLCVLPTGTGKSIVIAELVRQLVTNYSAHVLMLTHVSELIQQNLDKLLLIYPDADVGVFSASLNKKELHNRIIFGGIQSIANHIHKRDAFDIIIIDEAHLVSQDDDTQYKKVLALLKLMNPNCRVIGFTATPYRMTTGTLVGDIFDCIIHEVNILDMIKQGYLCNLVSKSGKVHIDTSQVHMRGGEYIAGELEAAAMSGDITEQAVSDMVNRASDRKSWIVFATGIDHAKQINDCLIKHGIVSEIITGKTPKEERKTIINCHKSGKIRCLVNVQVLTTGFDNPRIDMIGVLRPTGSPGLWVQILGRGFRVADGKENCLVLDYTDNSVNFGPIDQIRPPSNTQGSGDGMAPCKECPECTAIIHAALMTCPWCGYQFPEPEKDIRHIAGSAPLLSNQIEPIIRTVKKTYFSVHEKPGKDACVKVEYDLGFGEYQYDWIFPLSKFKAQYIKLCKEFKIQPFSTAKEWVENAIELEGPHTIWTIPDGKYTRVVRREFYADKIPF